MGTLETYVEACRVWSALLSVEGGRPVWEEWTAMRQAYQQWQDAGFPGYEPAGVNADILRRVEEVANGMLKVLADERAEVFALVSREVGEPLEPETLVDAVRRLAAFKYAEGRHDERQGEQPALPTSAT